MPEPTRLCCGSTNFYLIDCQDGKLLLDAGWPQLLPELKAQMKAAGVKLSALRWLAITHAHPDHAGLVQIVKRLSGARLLLHEAQVPALPALNALFERQRDQAYEPIQMDPGDVLIGTPNRSVLAALGIPGEFIATPGHSDDSISLLLDDGTCCVGDLTRPDLAGEANGPALRRSWQALLQAGARRFYPGHGEPLDAEEIALLLELGE